MSKIFIVNVKLLLLLCSLASVVCAMEMPEGDGNQRKRARIYSDGCGNIYPEEPETSEKELEAVERKTSDGIVAMEISESSASGKLSKEETIELEVFAKKADVVKGLLDRHLDLLDVDSVRDRATNRATRRVFLEQTLTLLSTNGESTEQLINNCLAAKASHAKPPQISKLKRNEKNIFKAIRDNDVKQVQLLLESDIDVNSPSTAGMTPLHLAMSMGSVEMVKLLLEYAPSIYVRNDSGLTPLDYLQDCKNKALIELCSNDSIQALRATGRARQKFKRDQLQIQRLKNYEPAYNNIDVLAVTRQERIKNDGV